MQKYTKKMFDERFPDDDACLEWLRSKLYPERIECLCCKKSSLFHRVKGRKVYECDYCGYQLSPMAGTILEKSSTSLRDWFYAAFLMASTRTGISAMQLKRELGVTYKTAWRMFTQIRKLMNEGNTQLFGQKDKNRHQGKRTGIRGRGASGKTIVVGLVERGGKAVVKVTPSVEAKELIPIITEHIPVTGTTTIFTDELPSYNNLRKMGFAHERVQHSAKQYVNGTAHVNNVEGLWSIVKNGIVGVNRHVSPQHMQGYLDSYVFRYNHRQDETPMFSLLLGQIPSGAYGTRG